MQHMLNHLHLEHRPMVQLLLHKADSNNKLVMVLLMVLQLPEQLLYMEDILHTSKLVM